MATCQTRNLTLSLLVALLPMNVALAGGRGGVPQGAVGSVLSGSSGYGAAVGGGAPAGAVGGGAPAGLIGGGVGPTNTNRTSSTGTAAVGPGAGGVPGAYTGVPSAPPDTFGGGLPPGNSGSAEKGQPQRPVAPKSVEGVAATQDAVSTQLVAPRPCGVAAHETDGFTTCIGILPSGHARSGRARRHTGDMRRPAHMARS
jgi:hypothetical protein